MHSSDSQKSGSHEPRPKKLSLAKRREELLLACEYDRLQMRLVSARTAVARRSSSPASSMAKALVSQLPLRDMVRLGAFMMPKKYRTGIVLLAAGRRILRKMTARS